MIFATAALRSVYMNPDWVLFWIQLIFVKSIWDWLVFVYMIRNWVTTHSGFSSFQIVCRIKTLDLELNVDPESCKRGSIFHFGMKSSTRRTKPRKTHAYFYLHHFNPQTRFFMKTRIESEFLFGLKVSADSWKLPLTLLFQFLTALFGVIILMNANILSLLPMDCPEHCQYWIIKPEPKVPEPK